MGSVTFIIANFVMKIVRKGVKRRMKLMNYDRLYLINQNLRITTKEVPKTFTLCQYQILCRLIEQKNITKKFFRFLLLNLFNLDDWRKLDYSQMYHLIHVITFWDYEKRGK